MSFRFKPALGLMLLLSSALAGTAQAHLLPASANAGCDAESGELYSPPRETPQWAADVNGDPVDVVQFYLHGPLPLLKAIFTREGWTEAVAGSIPDDVVYIGGVLFGLNWIIQRMPVSVESLCGQKMVDAFEFHNHAFGGREHFRIFANGQDKSGRSVWAVSASKDIGIRLDPERPLQLFINHSSERNEDLERERVLEVLVHANAITSIDTLDLAPTGYGQDNGAYSPDGKVYDLELH